MTQVIELKIEGRNRVGTGGARASRVAGFVPGIIYGDNKQPVPIQVARNILEKQIFSGGFFTRLFDVTLNGEKQRVLARDVQFHPVKDMPEHVDFIRVSDKTVINIEIPIHIVGQEQSEGIRDGGVLNMVRHAIELYVKATDIPEYIEIDVSQMKVGDNVHLGDVKLPQGSRPVDDLEITLVQLAAPRALVEEEPVAAPVEGEAATAEGAAAAGAEGTPAAAGAAGAKGAAPGAAPKAPAAKAPAKGGKE